MSGLLCPLNINRLTFLSFSELFFVVITAIISLVIPIKSPEFKWIRIYCVINGLAGLIADFMALNRMNNIPIVYLLIWVETLVLIQYFRSITSRIERINKVWFFVFVYSIFSGILLLFENFHSFNSMTQIFEAVLIFLLGVIYFREELKSPTVPFVYEEPDFWFGAGLLIYYGSTWLILVSIKFITLEHKDFVYIWDFQNVLSILKYIAITIGLLCSRRVQNI